MPPSSSSPSSMNTSFLSMINDQDNWQGSLPQSQEPSKGVWSEAEHNRFLEAFKLYPQGPWKAITSHIGTRTIRQVQTHAQKYQEKVKRRARGLKTVHPRMLHRDHRIDEEVEPWWTLESGMLAATPSRSKRRRPNESEDAVALSTASQMDNQGTSDMETTVEENGSRQPDWADFEPLPFTEELDHVAPLPTLEECLAVVNECLLGMAEEA